MKLSDIGPGLLLAATGIGVGDMVSSTIAGAEYGLTLVWALAAGVVLKFAITEGAARWQLGTGNTLMEGWRDHLPRAAVLAFFLYFIVWSYFVSSALVAASALVPAAIIPSVPLPVWGFIHAVAAFTLVWFGRYERFLSVIKWFVGLKFGAVIGSVLLIVLWSGADWSHFGAKSAFSTSYTLSLIGGVGGTVTLLSYAYWMREAGWSGPRRIGSARADLTLSFCLVFIFCFSMIFLATQIDWTGQILEEGPRLCLLLADRIGAEIGPIGRGGVPARVLGRGVLVGARRLSRRAVSLRRLDPPVAAADADRTAGRGVSRVGRLSHAGGDLGAADSSSGLAGLCLHRRRLAVLSVRDLDAAVAEQLAACARRRRATASSSMSCSAPRCSSTSIWPTRRCWSVSLAAPSALSRWSRSRFSTLRRCAPEPLPLMRCARRSISRSTPSASAISATGSPSITAWRASPARRRRS